MSGAPSASRGLMWVVVPFLWSAATTLAATQQCWVAEISTVSFTFQWSESLGPYPDKESIFSAAQNKAFAVAESRCGGITAVDGTYHYDSDSCSAGVCIPWIRIREFIVRNEPAQCSTGFNYYGRNAALDAIPPPICAGTYTIRLVSDTSTESPDVLATIEPDMSTNLNARVYDQNNQLVPNVGVRLTLEAKENSGGHHHGDNTVAARTGTMNGQQVLIGNTMANGLQFSYKAPSVAGDYKIVASCTDGKNCQAEGADTVWVGVKGLVSIPVIPMGFPFATYQLFESNGQPVGRTDSHPDNHYLTAEAIFKLWNLGFRYSQIEFPNSPLLHINDASLIRGGLFDINADWDMPHAEHREGTVIDIRANGTATAIPQANFKGFQQIMNHLNMTYIFEGNHYHVRLLGIAQ